MNSNQTELEASTFKTVLIFFRDLSRLPLIQQMSHERPRKPHVVTAVWVTECVEAGTILKEQNYGP